MRILLAGATGLVGNAALTLLLADERCSELVAPTRRSLPSHPKLLNPIATSAGLPAGAEWWATDGAISAIGTTRAKAGSARAFREIDYDYVLAIARHVRKAGAKSFALTSSMGASSRSPFLYSRTKGELEEAIVRLGFESLAIVRPGLLGGERMEHRPLESMAGHLLRIGAPILPLSARISPAPTVAALLVGAVFEARPGKRVINSAEVARTAFTP